MFIEEEMVEEAAAQQALDDMVSSASDGLVKSAKPQPLFDEPFEARGYSDTEGVDKAREIIREVMRRELNAVDCEVAKLGYYPDTHATIIALAKALEHLERVEI